MTGCTRAIPEGRGAAPATPPPVLGGAACYPDRERPEPAPEPASATGERREA